jgi:hypothetical protein
MQHILHDSQFGSLRGLPTFSTCSSRWSVERRVTLASSRRRCQRSVSDAVRIAAGPARVLDIVSDGEMSKVSYATYVRLG